MEDNEKPKEDDLELEDIDQEENIKALESIQYPDLPEEPEPDAIILEQIEEQLGWITEKNSNEDTSS